MPPGIPPGVPPGMVPGTPPGMVPGIPAPGAMGPGVLVEIPAGGGVAGTVPTPPGNPDGRPGTIPGTPPGGVGSSPGNVGGEGVTPGAGVPGTVPGTVPGRPPGTPGKGVPGMGVGVPGAAPACSRGVIPKRVNAQRHRANWVCSVLGIIATSVCPLSNPKRAFFQVETPSFRLFTAFPAPDFWVKESETPTRLA